MLIRVPIVYQASFIRPRCRNVECGWFGEWMDVDVDEVGDIDAPVAIRWNKYGSQDPGDEREVRWFDGRHFEPAHYEYSGRDPLHIDSEWLVDACANGQPYGNPLVLGSDWIVGQFVQGKIGVLSELPVRTHCGSEREEAIDAAIRAARKTILVDGLVWKQRSEPVYALRRGGGLSIDVVNVTEVGSDRFMRPDGVFRLDRFDDMIDYIDDHRRTDEGGLDRCRADVLIPDCIRYDDETPALLYGASQALEWGRDRIADAPRGRVISWLDLRDTLALAGEDASDDALERIATVLSAYEATLDDDWYRQTIGKMLDRWRLRPMTMSPSGISASLPRPLGP